MFPSPKRSSQTEVFPERYPHFSEDRHGIFAGRHLTVDFWGAKNLTDPEEIEGIFRRALDDTGAIIVNGQIVEFDGGGCTGSFILKESHCAFHAYPECEAIFFDIFTCGSCDPRKALPKLLEFFKPERVVKAMNRRGVVELNKRDAEKS